MEQIINNKSIIIRFYQQVIGQLDTSLVTQYIAEDYIQHNPMLRTGRAGVLESLSFLKQMPGTEVPAPFVRMFGEGEYVVVHMCVEVFGQKKAVLDIFRIEDGLLREHWDAIQDIIIETGVNGHHVIEGPVEVQDVHLTAANKAVVAAYCREVLKERQLEKLGDYVKQDLIQHHPAYTNGRSGLRALLQGYSIEDTYRIIGEGNFVMSQSRGTMDGMPYVFYEIYRLSEGQIAEQWHVNQRIPEVMAHANGMI